jgi:phosphopantothenoylcysteine decarboxylase
MKILLGVTGSIAALLTLKTVKALQELGEVRLVYTNNAGKMMPAPDCKTYSDWDEWNQPRQVLTDYKKNVLHIVLRDWYDVFVIAPLSCNTLAKMAHGMCDNLLTTIWMASLNKKVIVAPAMNTQMWKHPLVEANIHTLKKLNVQIVQPISKTLACGEVGIGAMANIDDIVSAVKLSIT